MNAKKTGRLRAFRVVTDYFEKPETSIILSTSPARAKYQCWDSAHSVGYLLQWKSLKVRRAPEYDTAQLIPDNCYGEDFAKLTIPPPLPV